MTLNPIVQDGVIAKQMNLAGMLHEQGVSAKFFDGNGVIDGFSIVIDGVRHVVIDTSFPPIDQYYAAIRELHVVNQLQEGQSSLFL